MKKSVISVVCFIMLMCIITGCGVIAMRGSKQPSEMATEIGSKENESSSLLGLISEVTEASYKVKVMGYYVNEIEMYVMVDCKLGEFAVGDDVMITIEGKPYLVDGDGNKVEYDNTSQWGVYLKDKTEVLFEGEITSLTACENDGVFEGTVTGFSDLLNADMEPIGLLFCIKPLEGEPEAGNFSFTNLDLGYGFDLNARVEVTYDPETLEIISVAEK